MEFARKVEGLEGPFRGDSEMMKVRRRRRWGERVAEDVWVVGERSW